MELLSALGLNSTIVPQFLVFLVAYLALTQLVFKPYLAAFEQRQQATFGNQESAEQILEEAKQIQQRYEIKAREVNAEIRSLFEAARKDSAKIQEQLVSEARAEAEQQTKTNRDKIRTGVQAAREDLKKYVPELAQAISNRLLGKETH